VKVFVGLGAIFLAATPDTKYTSEALQRRVEGADLDKLIAGT